MLIRFHCIKYRNFTNFLVWNFVERHSLHIGLGKSPETIWKLCLYAKFRHQEIRLNYSILRTVCVKLVKANAMLSKICYFVNETALWSIYFAIFSSHLSYACTAWGQSIVPSHRVWILQRNAPRIIYFSKFNNHTTQIFHKMKIIKFVALVSVENCIVRNKRFSSKSYSVFRHLCNLATGRHNHQTRFPMNGFLIRPNCNTAKFGTKVFWHSTIISWNSFQALFQKRTSE